MRLNENEPLLESSALDLPVESLRLNWQACCMYPLRPGIYGQLAQGISIDSLPPMI